MELRNKIMRIARHGMRGYIKLEHDGAGGPAQISTAGFATA
jgi:hypothetical protein